MFFFLRPQKSSSCSKDHFKDRFPSFQHHCTIPLYSIQLQQLPDVKPHLIDEDTPYRLWNIVSNGLFQRSPFDPTLLTCMGGFNSNNSKFNLHFKDQLMILLCKNYFEIYRNVRLILGPLKKREFKQSVMFLSDARQPEVSFFLNVP